MYYSAGTYESFAHPEKPEGVDNIGNGHSVSSQI